MNENIPTQSEATTLSIIIDVMLVAAFDADGQDHSALWMRVGKSMADPAYAAQFVQLQAEHLSE